MCPQSRERFCLGGVGLIEDRDRRFISGAEFTQDLEGGGVMLRDIGVGGVEDVNQEIRDNDFFQSGLEGFD